jgi:hypothetical protein
LTKIVRPMITTTTTTAMIPIILNAFFTGVPPFKSGLPVCGQQSDVLSAPLNVRVVSD